MMSPFSRHLVSLGLSASVLAVGSMAYAEPSLEDAFPREMPPADVAIDDGPAEVDGEIAIDLIDSASDADISAFAARYGLVIRPNSEFSSAEKLEIADVDASGERALLERLEHDPLVEHAEPMALYRALMVPNDPLYAIKQWHLTRVGAERGWEYSCGRGITVAVIDTGIACFDSGPFTRGTDLGGTRCQGGYDFVNDRKEAADDHGHGTHVAGTIAQTTNNGMGTAGLSYCATLMPIKVLSKQGYGTVADVAEGIRFAADHGAGIVNMSLGGPIKSKILEDAVTYATKKGTLIVAAAGNSGRSVGYPAAYPDVLAVSATDSNDKIAWFSSRGPEVGLAAPGVGVTQQTICEGGKNKCEVFGTFNGTSMASPHVAGAAAMLAGAGVTDADAIRSALEQSAKPKDDKTLYGAGLLDAGAAVSRAHWGHVVARLVALVGLALLLARRLRARRERLDTSSEAMLGALAGAVGLLPIAPLFHLGTLGVPSLWVDLLARPFGEWDLLASAALHRWLPLASALPSLAGVALFFSVPRLRRGVGGLALGTAALASQMALSGDVSFVFGAFGLRMWALANVAVCLWLARMCLGKSTS